MKTESKADFVTRDAILKLLSDDEVSRVSTEETKKVLVAGEEYLDLERLEQGVRTGPAEAPVMGRLIARSSVLPETWSKILARLATLSAS